MSKNRLLVYDLETYYDDKYSLSRMTTEQYVRDPRFELQLIKIYDGSQMHTAWGDDILPLWDSFEMNRPGTFSIAHNGRFDHGVMELGFNRSIWMKGCTMLMARQIGLSRLMGCSLSAISDYFIKQGFQLKPKGHTVAEAKGKRLTDMDAAFRARYEKYCDTDVYNCYAFALEFLKIINQNGARESLLVMDMVMSMFTRPAIEIDTKLLTDYASKLDDMKQQNLQALADKYAAGSIEGMTKVIRSKPGFAKILIDLGVQPPMKVSGKKTETIRKKDPNAPAVMDYAMSKTDLDFLALLEHPDSRVVDLVEAKLGNTSSIARTRTESFLQIAERGRLPIPIEYGGAHTNRFSGSEKINLQNLPKRTGDKTLRKSLRAPEGYFIGGADSSQIEARCLAYAADEKPLLNIFATGQDPYSFMGEAIYGVPSQEIFTAAKNEGHDMHRLYLTMRNVGKQTVLGSGYQMGKDAFALWLKQMGVTLTPTKDEAQKYIQRVFPEYPDVSQIPKDKVRAELATWLETYHENEAARINKIYRSTNTQIVRFWKTCQNVLKEMVNGNSGKFGGPNGDLFEFNGRHQVMGFTVPAIRMPDGFWMIYPDLTAGVNPETGYTEYTYTQRKGRSTFKQFIHGGKLCENIIQAWAFAIMKWQAVRIHKEVPVILNVHDEWISVFPIAQLDHVKSVYVKWMSTPPPYAPDLPIACEWSHGETYGDC